ncbi:MAG: LPXTG cell wall anchor domain-containing protein, partial [Oscillospiraceae bacterium]
IDGVWKVTNPVVTIEVEKQACVKVVFKTEGGMVLEEVGYEDYYGEIREGLVSIQAPDGYEIVGNDQYAVNVTRDEDGRLVADPTEVTIIVKKIEAEKPQEPSKPEKPTTPTQPSKSDDKDNPQTGDSSNLLLWFIVMVASSGTLSVLLIKRSQIAKCFKKCRSRAHFD